MQHFFEGLHYKFTILTFTKTWLTEYNSSLHNFIGYSHVYKRRDKKRRGSIYRPPSIQQNLFMEKLSDLLNYLTNENKLIFILDDFDIDTGNAIINPYIGVNNFQNTFLSYFYTPLIDKFTGVGKKGKPPHY